MQKNDYQNAIILTYFDSPAQSGCKMTSLDAIFFMGNKLSSHSLLALPLQKVKLSSLRFALKKAQLVSNPSNYDRFHITHSASLVGWVTVHRQMNLLPRNLALLGISTVVVRQGLWVSLEKAKHKGIDRLRAVSYFSLPS